MQMAFENRFPTRGLGPSAEGRIAPARAGGRAQAGPLARSVEMALDGALAQVCADLCPVRGQIREGIQ